MLLRRWVSPAWARPFPHFLQATKSKAESLLRVQRLFCQFMFREQRGILTRRAAKIVEAASASTLAKEPSSGGW